MTWILVVGALGWFGVHEWNARKETATDRLRYEERLHETQRTIDAFVASTGSAADWKITLCQSGNVSHILTADLQSVLLRSDNRPVLVSGDLSDVRQEDGGYIITVSSRLCRGAQLRIEATADPGRVADVLAHRSGRIGYVALALRATTVQKQPDNPVGGNDGFGDGVIPEDEFLVRGQCLEI